MFCSIISTSVYPPERVHVFPNLGNASPYLGQCALASQLGQSPLSSEQLHGLNRALIKVVCKYKLTNSGAEF